MITIKTTLFLPSLVVILAGRLVYGSNAREAVRHGVAAALSAAVGFAFLYWLHGSTVDQTGAETSVEVAAERSEHDRASGRLLPRLEVLVGTLRWDLAYWAFLLVGAVLLAQRIRQTTGRERWRWVDMAALSLPVASLARVSQQLSLLLSVYPGPQPQS